MKIAFFDTKQYDENFFNNANKKYGFKLKYFKPHLSEDTVALSKGYDVVCVFVNDDINKNVINKLKENGVKLIALRCAGYNNVDLEAAKGKIKVVRVPSYSPYAVAEHTVALIMTLNRKIHKSYLRVREGNFTLNGLMGFDMHKKTAGIIGTGKIAKIVIKILNGFGMDVLAYDKYPDKKAEKELGFRYVTLKELYCKSDIISLHCPLTTETKYIINEESISNMKDGVMIINTGRGKLIDTKSIIKGLKTKKISAAGLDVYEEEDEYFFEDMSGEIITDDLLARLLTFNNVIVTSHQAFFTKEALYNITETTLGNIDSFFKGKIIENEIEYE
ncbi:2-hydroxyacid dehydrogenase [Haliovirga abyssi]|uniref:2-hydroxyacid dehydrogenase n=2 Tax=Haliovirga abyssi TaxID=2996794 RepID=A0AAU9DGD6_9FUSO|nr:2-hydroxyacid dehydrogenase [Haliovirga abyssi]